VDVDEEEDIDKVVEQLDVDKVVDQVDVDEVVKQIAVSGCACHASQKPNRWHLMQVLN
jgi:hypothetical protein